MVDCDEHTLPILYRSNGQSRAYVSARLLAATGASWSISLYLLAMALISFVSVLLLSETYRSDISKTRSEERQLIAESEDPTAG